MCMHPKNRNVHVRSLAIHCFTFECSNCCKYDDHRTKKKLKKKKRSEVNHLNVSDLITILGSGFMDDATLTRIFVLLDMLLGKHTDVDKHYILEEYNTFSKWRRLIKHPCSVLSNQTTPYIIKNTLYLSLQDRNSTCLVWGGNHLKIYISENFEENIRRWNAKPNAPLNRRWRRFDVNFVLPSHLNVLQFEISAMLTGVPLPWQQSQQRSPAADT